MNIKLKNILLLPALAIACTGCNNDPVDGEISLTGDANEIQLVIAGNGEGVDYTKAIASESENKIENLDVYIFASDAQAGTYRYLDKWESAAANDKTLKKFALQASGSEWNASIFPSEVAGYPFLKLFLVANREDELYQENGATALTLTPFTSSDNFDAATDEATFLQSYTKALTVDKVLYPSLLMTGNGATKMLGTVSNVKIELKRVVARFDIDNTARTSNLTIQSIALKQGRKTGTLWSSGTLTPIVDADLATSPLLMEYKEVDYTALANANTGVTESAIYTYPTLATDKAYLIIKGTYHDPVSNSDKPAAYTVPLQKTDGATGTTADIAILRNNRYKLRIIDVTSTTMAAAFEIEDWTSSGGITIKPEAPVSPITFSAIGANVAEVGDDKIRVDVDGGTFTLTVSHINDKPVTIETTPEYEPTYGDGDNNWITIAPVTRATTGVAKTVTITANNSADTDQKPHEVHIGYITVKWGDTTEEQMKLEIYRGASSVTYLDPTAGQTVRFAAVKMKDDRYWAPINVGAKTAKNKATKDTNTDITDDAGKLFQWGRSYGFKATNNANIIDEEMLGDLNRPEQTDLANMSKWDGKFIGIYGVPELKKNWLLINGIGNPNPEAENMEKGAWYQQLWNANEGKESADVVKTPHDPCPEGWRVPTSAEWKAIGADQESDQTGYTWDGINLCSTMPGKENGKRLLLPAAGYREDSFGSPDNQGISGYYWSSSVPDASIYAECVNCSNKIHISSNYRVCGYSVRCIQE
ncbi:hypothetical protein DXD68_18285 [Parabacteroides sp. TM07-1AC]|uniref:FISUMP domain-containing protein n=1 Tax=Parabacteroides sp. TM07-1AC TaxID=2292363 RepID=UPI000EFEB125|nr:FISUMP domain-containing protein [Parabacteroides sp. TM07-1AC]RHU23628.1 hypothetical protein DXD68_18285 [Parabacteroides sp. TM07-1AC]